MCFSKISSCSLFWTLAKVRYVRLCSDYLPGFPITHIGFSISYARQFLKFPNVSFNILQKVLVSPQGKWFLRDARAAGRPVYVWTVNSTPMMRWCISKAVDGVITDDPKKFLELCDDYDYETSLKRLPFRTYIEVAWVIIPASLLSILFRWRYDSRWKSWKRWAI